ncbi:DUF4097 family beta strand repeat protein [Halobacillus locisalis]|uniref:DUF4097 family beta strand repeat protein n=1 Tax=Halobacillus locisalis TaxID=220753 RepID=A0A838CSN7_9BACI|nr:DUF4097 family beta strand repeat-containing protein [Halobacillus locisalis]MBA2174775.1 DUF4097 family beta strand repeat protein [Halobacillus locisalis]
MKILSVSIVIVLVVIGIGYLTLKSTTNVFSSDLTTIDDQRSLSSKGIEKINVSTSSSDITIFEGAGDQIRIELSGELSHPKQVGELYVETRGDQLLIEFPKRDFKPSFSFGSVQNRTKLNVLVPEKTYETLTAHSSSGDINVSQLNLNNLDVSSSSGDQFIKDMELTGTATFHSSSGRIQTHTVSAEQLTVKTSSGDIENKKVSAERSESNSSSGDVEWLDHEPDTSITVRTSSGDTDISLLDDPLSTEVSFSSSSGEASISQEAFTYEEISDHRVKGSVGDGEAHIDVTSSSGDFNLR